MAPNAKGITGLRGRSEEHTSELQSHSDLVCRLLLEKKKLTSEGSFWLRQRRLAQPAFHRQRIAAMAARMTRAAVNLCSEWEGKTRSAEPFSMVEEMSGLTLRVFADALFVTGLPGRAASLRAGWDVLGKHIVFFY